MATTLCWKNSCAKCHSAISWRDAYESQEAVCTRYVREAPYQQVHECPHKQDCMGTYIDRRYDIVTSGSLYPGVMRADPHIIRMLLRILWSIIWKNFRTSLLKNLKSNNLRRVSGKRFRHLLTRIFIKSVTVSHKLGSYERYKQRSGIQTACGKYWQHLSVRQKLILSEEKDDIIVEYAMLNDKSKLVVSKYQLYLPDIEQLKNKVKEIIDK